MTQKRAPNAEITYMSYSNLKNVSKIIPIEIPRTTEIKIWSSAYELLLDSSIPQLMSLRPLSLLPF